jgi:tetratricopeptide (TPR) repeat protein
MDKQKIRSRAAAAVARLAQRADELGTDKSVTDHTALKAGWVPGGNDFGLPVRPSQLQEAVAYYDIAIELDPLAAYGYYYQQGLVFEKLSDFSAAIAAFEAAVARYPDYAPTVRHLVDRCREKLAGVHDPAAAMAANMSAMFGKAFTEVPGLRELNEQVVALATAQVSSSQTFEARHDSRNAQFPSVDIEDDGESQRQFIEFAESFADSLVRRDFDVAHAKLSQALQQEYSIEKLTQSFDDMFAGVDASSADVHAESDVMDDWPEKQPDERLWVYVSIECDDAMEAVTVTVAGNEGALFISSIEWGRP